MNKYGWITISAIMIAPLVIHLPTRPEVRLFIVGFLTSVVIICFFLDGKNRYKQIPFNLPKEKLQPAKEKTLTITFSPDVAAVINDLQVKIGAEDEGVVIQRALGYYNTLVANSQADGKVLLIDAQGQQAGLEIV